jgi:hypothetical protein
VRFDRERAFMIGLVAATLLACSATPPPAPAPAPPPPPPPFDETATWAEIDDAERVLAVSAGDCLRACEAASAISSASTRLCEHHVARCDEAKLRQSRAVDASEQTCGACPTSQ